MRGSHLACKGGRQRWVEPSPCALLAWPLPLPGRCPLTSQLPAPPGHTLHAVCFAESFRWLVGECLLYFSCRWQTAGPPHPHPHTQHCVESRAARRNKSLAGEQPRLAASFIQPEQHRQYLYKIPFNSPSSATLPAWLPSCCSPLAPQPSQTHLLHTVPKETFLFFWLPIIAAPSRPRNSNVHRNFQHKWGMRER